jgi:hypothetical protein
MKVADLQHFIVDPDPAFHFNADTDPDPAHRQSAAITCLNNLQASIMSVHDLPRLYFETLKACELELQCGSGSSFSL